MKRKNKVLNPASDKLANIIVHKTILMQTRWASFMQRKVEKLSLKSKKNFLLSFSLLTFGYSVYLIAQSLTGHIYKQAFSVTPIHIPKHIIQKKNSAVISEKEYQQIQIYKKYMDSCGLT